MPIFEEIHLSWDDGLPDPRLQDGVCCAECGYCMDDLKEDDSTALAFVDKDDCAWCESCFASWNYGSMLSNEENIVCQHSGPSFECEGCGDELPCHAERTEYWDEDFGRGTMYCMDCTTEWQSAQDFGTDTDADEEAGEEAEEADEEVYDYGSSEADEEAYDYGSLEPWCAECEVVLGVSPYVVDASTGAGNAGCYCMDCWDPPTLSTAAKKRARDDDSHAATAAAAAEKANAARNERNITKLRARFPTFSRPQLERLTLQPASRIAAPHR